MRRPGQEFGLVQHQGGPCGPIAAVQAHVLQHLLPNTRPPTSTLKTNVRNWSTVQANVLGDVLIGALTTILVRVTCAAFMLFSTLSQQYTRSSQARAAGFFQRSKYSKEPVAVVALSGAANRNITSSSAYSCDGFTESLELYKFRKVEDLKGFLQEGSRHLRLLTVKASGNITTHV